MNDKPKAPIPMSLHDRQIAMAKQRITLAQTEDMKRFYAEQVIGLRFERGDFPMIQALDTTTRRALVAEMLEPQQEPTP